MLIEFREIGVDPRHECVVILPGQGLTVQIPQGQLLRQQLVEDRILILLDGLVDAAVGKGAGGDKTAPVPLHQLGHPLGDAVGEDLALHLIVFLDAVITSGGIQHPVSYVYQIQQIPEFLVCQFELHKEPPPISL